MSSIETSVSGMLWTYHPFANRFALWLCLNHRLRAIYATIYLRQSILTGSQQLNVAFSTPGPPCASEGTDTPPFHASWEGIRNLSKM